MPSPRAVVPAAVTAAVVLLSGLLYWLAILPITTAWDNALGLGLVVLFLLALTLLPPGRDLWLITLATVSSATMLAIERANVDLLMFVMAMLVVRLRVTGYLVALLAGMLKFYPIVLLISAVRERLVACLAVWTVAVGVVALWFALGAIIGVAQRVHSVRRAAALRRLAVPRGGMVGGDHTARGIVAASGVGIEGRTGTRAVHHLPLRSLRRRDGRTR
jgi:hypothetical protein